MTDYNDGKWHVFSGDEKPETIHDKSIVEYIWHDPNMNTAGKTTRQAGYDADDASPAWPHVLKLRVVKEYRDAKEYTIDPSKNNVWWCHEDGLIHVREVQS